MITNQNKEELQVLSKKVEAPVFEEMQKCRGDGVMAGVYHGENMTDCIWIKNGLSGSFFFVSPCLRNARAESFIDRSCGMEYTLHMVERCYERTVVNENYNHNEIKVCGNMDSRTADIVRKLASFYVNERTLGTIAHTKGRGKVLRTTHGLILCSEKELHSGVCFANTFISDNELKGTQLEAVQLFDRRQYFSAELKYMEYFDGK